MKIIIFLSVCWVLSTLFAFWNDIKKEVWVKWIISSIKFPLDYRRTKRDIDLMPFNHKVYLNFTIEDNKSWNYYLWFGRLSRKYLEKSIRLDVEKNQH